MPFGMTDLEEQLRGEAGAARGEALVARLSSLVAALDDRLRQGLAPDAYKDAQTVRKSVAAALDLMVYTRRFRDSILREG